MVELPAAAIVLFTLGVTVLLIELPWLAESVVLVPTWLLDGTLPDGTCVDEAIEEVKIAVVGLFSVVLSLVVELVSELLAVVEMTVDAGTAEVVWVVAGVLGGENRVLESRLAKVVVKLVTVSKNKSLNK